jgi:NAD(P)-dependent dehydrogenase (short-subunit alcohol dehydrogenase family)
MLRVLVTGANRGIGLEFARQLLARGDRVYATCRHPGRALALTELAAAHPGRLTVLPLDVASERSIAELARELGTLHAALDVLINNAGILVGGERFGGITAEALLQSFATNAAGPLLLTQALLPYLQTGVGAKVLNLSSELGSLARASRFGTPSYAISKAALNMVTRQLAHALGPLGIVVLCVHPGWVRTDMGSAQAPLTPRESVTGLLAVLDAAGPADAGKFLDYTGAAVPW